MDTRGAPSRLVWHVRLRYQGASDVVTADRDYDLKLTDWGTPVDIGLPPGSEIEPGFSLIEEAVLSYHEAPLLGPTVLPNRWILQRGQLLDAATNLQRCTQVELQYVDPVNAVRDYMYLYESKAPCASAPPAGAVPFRAGDSRGWILVQPSATRAQIVVGKTTVDVRTDLTPATLSETLATLAPLVVGGGVPA